MTAGAMQAATADLQAGAEAVVRHMIENRARAFQVRPQLLDTAVMLGLSVANGRATVATVDHLLEHGGQAFAAPVRQRDLRAARLYGEWLAQRELRA